MLRGSGSQLSLAHKREKLVMARSSTSPQERADKLAEKIRKQVERASGKGIEAARIFITARIREALSAAAPRTKVVGPNGVPYWRATSPATPGAPPRVVSGRGRQSLWSRTVPNQNRIEIGANARSIPSSGSPKGIFYMMYHESKYLGKKGGLHPWIKPVVQKYRKEIQKILGAEIASLKLSLEGTS